MAQAARLASRLQRELRMLQSDPPPGVSAWPFNDHLLTHLQAQIDGPQGTVYANGVFKLDIQVPERYPFEPPNIKFVTPVYHPNIDNGGRICLDILNLPPKGAWRPSLNLSTLLASIGLLLAEPNPDDGLMGEITAEYKHDKLSFDIKAKKWTELYARQDQVTVELNEPKTSSNTQSNQNCTTSGVHGQEPMQAARSNGEHMSSTCGVLSQPLKFGLSLSKRLALNRGVASLQQNKAASSAASQDQITQIQHTEASDQISSLFGSGSEGTGLQAKACRSQILKEPGEQSKNELASGTCDVTSLDRKKPPSHLDDNVERLSRDSNKSLSNEMAAGSSNTPLDAAIALLERSAGVRKSSRPDGSCSSPPVSVSAKVLSNNLVNEGECWNQSILRKKVQACKNVSVDKENRSPKHCPAMKPKSVISPLSVAEKKMAELQPMEASGNVNSSMSTCINSAHGYGGKERGHLCLPSRTKSLKLTRARLDVQPLHATTVQQSVQSIPIEKKQTSPIIIPDDVPTVVVSDSGSESELSDEGFTLSLTQRSLINKRKANSKLR